MHPYLALIRPLNAAMASAAVVIGGLVALGPGLISGAWREALEAAIVAAMFTGAGNALNDYMDREVDRVNHPLRPIPSGLISPWAARTTAALLFASSLPPAFILGLGPLGIVLLNLAAMLAYEAFYKKKGFAGNLLISYLVASLFLFGGVGVLGRAADPPAALGRTLILFTLAFIATLGREVVKDMEDVAGDVDRVTLPKALGMRRAGLMASGAFVLAVGLSVLPYLLGILPNLQYLITVGVADAMFIYCALYSRRKPQQIGRASKYAMLVALAAFLLGGLA